MTNYSVGHEAEKVAAEYLHKHGFAIKELNWKNSLSEIDIVAEKSKVIYFVEVKYRQNQGQGSGLDYITPKKINQMEFAAKNWTAEHRYDGDYELSAIEVSADFVISEFIAQLT